MATAGKSVKPRVQKVRRIITGLELHDCTSGFKCFRRQVLEAIDFVQPARPTIAVMKPTTSR